MNFVEKMGRFRGTGSGRAVFCVVFALVLCVSAAAFALSPSLEARRSLIREALVRDVDLAGIIAQLRAETGQIEALESSCRIADCTAGLEAKARELAGALAGKPGFAAMGHAEKMRFPEYRRLVKMRNFLELFLYDAQRLRKDIVYTRKSGEKLWPAFLEFTGKKVLPDEVEAARETFIDLFGKMARDTRRVLHPSAYFFDHQRIQLGWLARALGMDRAALEQAFNEFVFPLRFSEDPMGTAKLEAGKTYFHLQKVACLNAFAEDVRRLGTDPVAEDETIVHYLNPEPETIFATHATQPAYLAQMAALGFIDFDAASEVAGVERKSGGVLTGVSFQVGQVQRTFGQAPNPYPFGDPRSEAYYAQGFQYFQMAYERPNGQYGVFIPYRALAEGVHSRGVSMYSDFDWDPDSAQVLPRKILELGFEGAQRWMQEIREKIKGEWFGRFMAGDKTALPNGHKKFDRMKAAVKMWRRLGVAETGADPFVIESRQFGEHQGEIVVHRTGREPAVDLRNPENRALLMVPAVELESFILEVFSSLLRLEQLGYAPVLAAGGARGALMTALERVVPYDEANLQLAMTALENADLDAVHRRSVRRIWAAVEDLSDQLGEVSGRETPLDSAA